MSDETKINCSYFGTDTTATLKFEVVDDVQVTVVLNKCGNGSDQLGPRVEAMGKAIEILMAVANGLEEAEA